MSRKDATGKKKETGKSAHEFRFLGNEALGAHRARKGFRFQDLWLSLQLLNWINQEDFRGVINEGADDVDACWYRGARRDLSASHTELTWQIHQLKDTLITRKLLAKILDSFVRKAASFPDSVSRYHLVATRCAEELRSLRVFIKQTRNHLVSYGAGSSFAEAAMKDFSEKLVCLGCNIEPSFVLEHVELDFDAGWVVQNEVFKDHFYLKLTSHGVPPEQLENAAQALVSLVSGEKVGALISREALLGLLKRFQPQVVQQDGSTTDPAAQIFTRASLSLERTQAGDTILITVLAGGGALLRLPNGRYGLIDCSRSAASQVTAYLGAFEIETLEFVALTHWDADRFNGVITVLNALRDTKYLMLPPLSKSVGQTIAHFLSEVDRALGRQIIGEVLHTSGRSTIWSSGDRPQATRIESFAAAGGDDKPFPSAIGRYAVRSHASRNDLSSVYRVSVGNRHFLITGDALKQRWMQLFNDLVGPEESFVADGFTLPRHGSSSAMNKAILERIANPAGFYGVVDPAPIYGLPHAELIKLVREANGEVLVVDDTPVHLLLTADGLFERRFALEKAGELRVMRPSGRDSRYS